MSSYDMVYLGADHRGFELKEQVKEYLTASGYEIEDLGTDSSKSVDYPVIAEQVATKVALDIQNKGILICGSGTGVCIAANKIPGIRAGEASEESIAQAARNDDDINILCLSGDQLDLEEAKSIVDTFLNTEFEAVERRVRRLEQIENLENKY